MAFPKPGRSDSYKSRPGLHCVDTEVRSLDQALDRIAVIKSGKKNAAIWKARGATLRQQIAGAKGRAQFLKRHGKISLPGGIKNAPDAMFVKKRQTKHPFRDLDDAEKSRKIAEMIDSRCWGIGHTMYRRLAKLFDVPIGTIAAIAENGPT